ncbi:M48 family metalloprotease [Sphingorhabdus arenilitoris]|uniref:M48 family metalloprotease n=1 Tax=Sphingorhabdus arenilitoris TaxID=1490041 RepID=A0ABV8REQ7_9SPHN
MKYTKMALFMGASLAAASCTGGGSDGGGGVASASTPQAISQKEKQQGAEAHPQILNEFGGSYESPQTAYVVRVGKNIAVQSGLGNAQSDFTVSFLNSPVNNAFAIPGGYIYITRQLAALCNSEAEMAGVLGHEVGHVAARHSEKRRKSSTLAGILGAVGTIGGALLGDNSGLAGILGAGLKQYSGTVAQLFTLRYSRKQEEEADDLGIRYLSKAGYDPTALSDMLSSLAMQTTVDAQAAGRDARSIPEWASTHPDPARRVVRAANNAKAFAANTVRKQDSHFAAIDGMLYGDDPKQGVIEGQNFLHPDLRLKFTVPNGYGMQNTNRSVNISGNGGQALFTTNAQAYTGDQSAYIASAFKEIAGDQQVSYSEIRKTTVNGLPVFYATATVPTQKGGSNDLTIFAYEFSKSQAFHFATLAPSGSSPFDAMYQSVRRLSASEAGEIKPRKLRIVTVGRNDTVTSLSNRMAYNNLQKERFMALNGMRSDAALTAGSKVKIVTY